MSALHSPNQNHLLAALPAAEFAAIQAHLELVPLRLGDTLYAPGQQMQHGYFPTTAGASRHYVTATGASVETAGVGNDGVLGIALFMGGDTTTSSAMVQSAGHAYRMDRHVLKQVFQQSGLMRGLLLRYALALMTQVSQSAACNRHHSVEQQLSRWLLLTLDRAPERELVMTQELVAGLLGVRRESITEAAGLLQRAGHIRYRRGHIAVLSRSGLESCACECYDVVKKERRRLQHDVLYRQGEWLEAGRLVAG